MVKPPAHDKDSETTSLKDIIEEIELNCNRGYNFYFFRTSFNQLTLNFFEAGHKLYNIRRKNPEPSLYASQKNVTIYTKELTLRARRVAALTYLVHNKR